MAQTQSFTPLHQPLGVNQQRPNISGSSGFVVIDQQPSRTERFPYTLKLNWILGFSIAKCVLGGLLLIIGIVNVATVDYETKIAFGVWCGLTVSSANQSRLGLKSIQILKVSGGYAAGLANPVPTGTISP